MSCKELSFIFCEVQSRNKTLNSLCLSLMKSNGLVGVCFFKHNNSAQIICF